MTLAFAHGKVECWLIDDEYYVYAGDKLVRVCPSIGMAHDVAAGADHG